MTDRSARAKEPWYADGLRFSCTRCGNCCRGEPGFVWVLKDEITRMAAFLDISDSQFRKRYCRLVFSRISLMEYGNGDCVFYGPSGCKIYSVRPAQCRSFPFWSHVLENSRDWHSLKERCPGVGSGRLYSREEIEAIMEQHRS